MSVISVKNVRKKFKIYYDKSISLKEKLLFRGRNKYEERWVLDGISFEVEKGEAIGLIGQNGCGKSTTLKLLSKIMYPDEGSIEISGRVSSLIELGAGFHPDMSGRENIYTNAAIFGLSRKEIDERIEEIIEFAELGHFIDSPVRIYSSGMYMRLAFSIAVNVDADVLLVDEILAVGDASFQVKCFNKLQEIKNKGTTIVIVSHSLGAVEQFCDKTYWLDNGKIRMSGTPREVHPSYLQYMATKDRQDATVRVESVEDKNQDVEAEDEDSSIEMESQEEKLAVERIQVASIEVIDSMGKKINKICHGSQATVKIKFISKEEIENAIFGIGIYRLDGLHCYGTTTSFDGLEPIKIALGENEISVCFEAMELLAGEYSLDWAIATEKGQQIIYIHDVYRFGVYALTNEIGVSAISHRWEV